MKERPILFSAPMVRAILEGRKTQTRRVVKATRGRPIEFLGSGGPGGADWNDPGAWGYEWHDGAAFVTLKAGAEDHAYPCPYGRPGDRLWVRESFHIGEDLGAGWEPWMSTGDRFVAYSSPEDDDYCVPADYLIPRNAREVHNDEGTDEHWRSLGPIPSIFMPRWASRITLEITDVRVERLQTISEADAVAEGIERDQNLDPAGFCHWRDYGEPHTGLSCPVESYRTLWQSINGPDSWAANPWVWAVSFRLLTPTT